MAIVYSKNMFVERIKRHLANGFPKASFPIFDNEILLAIDAAIPFVMKGTMFENAKVTNVLDVPEAYLVTYNYTVTSFNRPTKEWYVTLAQTPIALPTGYDITDIYFASESTGKSQSVYFIKAKRAAYRNLMPKPEGIQGRVNGQTLYLQANNGASLLNLQLYVQMPISRTDDINAPMNLPDDAIQPLFDKVVATLLQRYGIPTDIIKDNLPAGNKSS